MIPDPLFDLLLLFGSFPPKDLKGWKSMLNRKCLWLYSIQGPLVSKDTTHPTAPATTTESRYNNECVRIAIGLTLSGSAK